MLFQFFFNFFPLLFCLIGQLYGLGITEVGKNVLLRSGQPIPPTLKPSLDDPVTKNVNFIGKCDTFLFFLKKNRFFTSYLFTTIFFIFSFRSIFVQNIK